MCHESAAARTAHSITTVAFALTALAPIVAFAQSTDPAAGNPTTLPRVRVQDEVLVEASRYTSPEITSATRTGTKLRDVPQAVSVITADLIRDQGMRSMGDVVRYVPGVTMGQGEGHRDAPTLRGNSSTADFFVDGVRDDVQYFRDVYNAERIEVLKGPNALIFGRGGGGGIINRVTKQADGRSVSELSLEMGSDERKRAAADFGGQAGERLALRLNTMYEDSESYRDFVEIERYGINPSARFDLSEATRLTVSYERFDDERTVDRGVPSRSGRPVAVSESRYFGNPQLSYSEATVDLAQAVLEHDFGNGLRLRNRTQYAEYDKYYQNVYPGSSVDANGVLTLDAYRSGTERENLFNQTDLIAGFTTGALSHTLLAGVELGRQDTANRRDNSTFGVTPAARVSLASPLSFADVAFDRPAQNNEVDVTVASFYLQDQVRLSERWQLIAGVRVERFDIELDNRLSGARLTRDDDMVSPRAGLIFQPFEPLALYASYSVSHLPSSGDQFSSLDPTSAALEPEEFENVEIGLKWDLASGLALTAAVYRLDRTNTRAPSAQAGAPTLLTGAQRSEGVELGVSGSITPRWQIVAGYAYQDAEIHRTTTAARRGQEIALVPEHQISMWNTYRFSPAWRAGLGVTYQSEMYASISNLVTLPSFTRVDAALYYTLTERFEAQLNVDNVLDERYYGTAHNDNNITPGAPTSVRLGVTTRF